ncbi:MAG: zinc metalloprotease HtpX [Microcystis sp.]|jgi:heat shock protein HtpX|uniref:Protease HtpX homolog n=3 Tax=Microcystis TaxID=1125 RepID=A0A0A1VX04_MICAE|nr:zinc metalloprotease HtpX [Microcystis aeruginosa]NCQ91472.1 zinc metalloprotease HtpX [Microcystis aeruginosa LG13-13]NCQ94425.1 zinc metalloprotease HtpX [Microcystis aeruginosa W11-03]NCR04675.1 zinc metalloprotease HtpX [Microcystis aeruginosa LG13-03]NCR61384.1 zinc metalloprotease HtpX [Microcystis aeruginosa LG11-05]NCR93050.1 zinc metalloprotease HtpX [Microcystis aeruginosa W11-06]REJ51333.1 MAG: protease HtpX [Microcystis wesenbergii TW10]TRU98612.1 MAG: protease HtpX [Microcyst
MNQLKTVALLGLLAGLLVAIGYAIGGQGGALIGLVIAAITNIGSWYFSDRIALAAYQAQPVSRQQAPELYQMVENLSRQANIPTPQLYIVPTPAANAFATGRDPEHAAVAVTEGILNLLPADELEAVIAHELTHVRNRDTLTQAVAATVAGAISYLARMLSYGFLFTGNSRHRQGGNLIGLLLTIFLAPLAATVIQMAISRTREFEADAGSARLTENPEALARALTRLESIGRQMPLNANPAFEPLLISSPFSGQFLANLFATHPSTEARIENLRRIQQELLT